MDLNTLNEGQRSAVVSDSDRILCLAGAGTGKTHAMISRITKLVEDGVDPHSILVLTFTNAAAFEMQQRYRKSANSVVTPEFRTFHSFCYSLISKDVAVRKSLGYISVPRIGTEDEMKRIKSRVRQALNISLSMSMLDGDGKDLPPKLEQEYKTFHMALNKEISKCNIITFNILCYGVCELFASDALEIKKYKQLYKYIFVDEFQDTDPKQFKFVSSFSDSKFFLVGDALQCQPAGTKVLVDINKNLYKNIEDVRPGDEVTSYDVIRGKYTTATHHSVVLATDVHSAYNVVEVVSANHRSKYTKDHITYARIHTEGNKNCRCLYLMYKSQCNWWKLGECRLFSASNIDEFELLQLAEWEGADRVWILKLFNGEDAYQCAEDELHVASIKYGIPDVEWSIPMYCSDPLRYFEYVCKMYEKLDLSTHETVTSCLNHYNLDINYPFYSSDSDKNRKLSNKNCFPIFVGNLVPHLMDVVVPTMTTNSYRNRLVNTFEEIVEVNPCPPCDVYSLEVSNHHNYVADGMLTHNCIYRFRGCTNSIIKMLSTSPAWEVHRLSENYRSTNQICKFANRMSRYASDDYRIEIEGHSDGPKVEEICTPYVKYGELPDKHYMNQVVEFCKSWEGSTAVLARTNAEVSGLLKYLGDSGIVCRTGKTNEEAAHILKGALDNQYLLDWLSTFLNQERYAEYIRLSTISEKKYTVTQFMKDFGSTAGLSKYMYKVSEVRKIVKDDTPVKDKCRSIQKLLKLQKFSIDTSAKNAKELVQYIIEELEKDMSADVYVGTVHSVKGLEYDNVIIINVGAKSWKLDNEDNLNLYYVAITRAKTRLVILES